MIFSYCVGVGAEQFVPASSAYQASTPSRSTSSATLRISADRIADAVRRFRGRRTARSARPRCAGARCTSPDGLRPCRRCAPRPSRESSATLLDRGQRIAAQVGLLHRDEPLRRGAERDRRLVAPAMRVAVGRACEYASSTPRSRSTSMMVSLAFQICWPANTSRWRDGRYTPRPSTGLIARRVLSIRPYF